MKKIILSNLLWILPFTGFIFGYFTLDFFIQKQEITTPNVIGKSLQESVKILSNKGLSLKLLREQEDSDLPEGIILDQIPVFAKKIRSNQHVFVTVSKKPPAIKTPDFFGKNHSFITQDSLKDCIQTQVFWVKSFYPSGFCFAQYPLPGQKLENTKLAVYLSVGSNSLYVVQNVKGKIVSEVQKRLEKENIKTDVFHAKPVDENHVCKDCRVIDQKPMPGSIVNLNKTLHMQLQVE